MKFTLLRMGKGTGRSGAVYLAALALAAVLGACVSRGPADLVLTHGVVHTMDPQRPRAEAVAIRGDRIVYVGSVEGAERYVGRRTRTIDLGGMTVLPGLVDAHAHLASLGRSLVEINLVGTASAEACRQKVLERQALAAADSWLQGRGWDQNDWADQSFPTWRDLAGTESHPVFLRRVDGHAGWLNRTALDVLGITGETPDPSGGRFVRDADGRPTGIVIDTAADWVRLQIPEPPLDEQKDRMRLAIKECNRYGLTGIHDAGVRETALALLRELEQSGELTLRVYAMLASDEPDFTRRVMREGPMGGAASLLTVRALKLYADGALGSRGARLLEPYADDPSNTGLVVTSRDSIEYWARLAIESGFQVAAHAIGDGGNRMVLDAYENVARDHPGREHRFRIEHAQVIAPGDIPRFAELGVIASVQPTHATSDMYWAEDRIGPQRVRGAYAWRQLIDSGCAIACGSDFPVEGVNPLWGIYAAVTRRDHDGWPAGGWYPDERMSMNEAVRGFTVGAAYAEFTEHLKGSIEENKIADLTVLNRDLFSIEPNQILGTHVTYTIVGGRIVYAASGPLSPGRKEPTP